MKKAIRLFLASAFVLASLPAIGGTLNLGDIVLSTGVSVNGVDGNEFDLDNSTGDCNGPVGVCTPVVFNNVVVSITPSGGSLYNVNVGDVPANSTLFDTGLFAPANVTFDLVTLTGTVATSSFLLKNGQTFQASSNQISAIFVSPIIGSSAPIQISGEIGPAVPEPGSLALFGGAALILAALKRRQGR